MTDTLQAMSIKAVKQYDKLKLGINKVESAKPLVANVDGLLFGDNWASKLMTLELNYCNWVNARPKENKALEARFIVAFNEAIAYLENKKNSVTGNKVAARVALLEEYSRQLGKKEPSIALASKSKYHSFNLNDKLGARVSENRVFIAEFLNSKGYKDLLQYYEDRFAADSKKKPNYKFFGSDWSVKDKGVVLGQLVQELKEAKTKNQVVEILSDFNESASQKDEANPSDYAVLATGQGLFAWVLRLVGITFKPGSLKKMDALSDAVLSSGPSKR